jgi:hypothetical protein
MSREEIERLNDEGMAAWDGHDAQAFANLFADGSTVNDVAMAAPSRRKTESANTRGAGRRSGRRRLGPPSRSCRTPMEIALSRHYDWR